MDQIVTGLSLLFDGILSCILVGVALAVVRSRDILSAIIFFIVFGLLMALAWVRLKAPDIALAEAALGAGVSGALLINAYARLTATGDLSEHNPDHLPIRRWSRTWFVLGSSLFAISLASVLLQLLSTSPSLGDQVIDNLPLSGVDNPVTAVLLNFRGYDTLLEMCVLFSALLGSLILTESKIPYSPTPNWVMQLLVLILVPVLLLVAGYLLWAGADHPGGAFQSGAVAGSRRRIVVYLGHC